MERKLACDLSGSRLCVACSKAMTPLMNAMSYVRVCVEHQQSLDTGKTRARHLFIALKKIFFDSDTSWAPLKHSYHKFFFKNNSIS